jgi:hypothetical protein
MLRIHLPPATFDERPPSFSDSAMPPRATCQAGAMPNSRPVAAASPSAKTRTMVSMRTSWTRGTLPALSVWIDGMAR